MAKKSEKIESSSKWEKETIPNNAILFCYVHKNNVNQKTGDPLEGAFRNTPFVGGTDLSSDWDKYSTAKETRQRLALQKKRNGKFKNSEDYFVVKIPVISIRTETPSQTLEHDPIQNDEDLPDNRSHTKIIGEKDVEVRLKFVDMCSWAISPKRKD